MSFWRPPRTGRTYLDNLHGREMRYWSECLLSTETSNRPLAEAAVARLFEARGLPAPKICWCLSPPVFFEKLYWLRENGPGIELWSDLTAWRDELFATLSEIAAQQSLPPPIQAPVVGRSDYPHQHHLEVGVVTHAVEQALRPVLPRLTFRSPPATLQTTVREAYEMLPSPQALALVRTYEEAKLPLSREMRMCLGLYRELAQNSWLWWPSESLCLFCERPARRLVDNRARLHSEYGACMEFRDGWRVHAWHGVVVPADVIERPGEITAERIDRERNIEIRRVLLERYGEDRYLEKTGARIIDTDAFGTLYSEGNDGAEQIVMVRVKNSTPEPDGSVKTYRLRVPPWMRTARQAIAWTFEMHEVSYAPEVET